MSQINIEDEKKKFLLNEIISSSIRAAFNTMNPKFLVYRRELNNQDRNGFREYIKSKLWDYKKDDLGNILDECCHVDAIQSFAGRVERDKKECLHKGKMRIGVTQKLLNLYFKYLWVLGYEKMPSACPFDSMVLKELGFGDKWTEMNDIRRYEKWVTNAKEVASKNGQSIAEWELVTFNKLNYKKQRVNDIGQC